jgi:O-antigen/teichoic acid export membrane protein/O-antigen ligase
MRVRPRAAVSQSTPSGWNASSAVDTVPRPDVPVEIPHARGPEAAPARGRRRAEIAADANSATVLKILTCYLVLLELVPSAWVVPALGAVGTPSNIFALLALLWYLAAWLGGRITPAPATRSPRVIMCFLAAALLLAYISLGQSNRAPLSTEVTAADRGLIGLAAWIGVVVVSSAGIRDYDRLQTLLRRAVLMGTAVAALGIFESFTKTNPIASLHIPGLDPVSTADQFLTRAGLTRPSSTAQHPLELAGVLTMLLPFAIQQALDPKYQGRLRKWAPVVLIGGMIPLTVSRTSIIGLVVVLIMLLPTWRPARRWAALVFLLFGALAAKVAVPGLGTTVVNMFSALTDGGDASTQARVSDYAGVAPYIAQRPWFGRGFGTFIPDLYRYTDNMYLLALVEIGIFGTLVIAALFLVGYRAGRLGRRLYTDEPRRELGQSFAAAMAAGLIVSGTFDSLTFPMFAGLAFLLLGLAGAYLGIARRDARLGSAEAEPEPPAYEYESDYEHALTELELSASPATLDLGPALSPEVYVPAPVPEPAPVALEEADNGPPTVALPVMPAAVGKDPAADPAEDPSEDPAPAAELGDRLRSGARWSLINTIVIRIGTFLTGVILARGLLGPRDWGLYAIGLTVLAVLLSANELGVSLAMVRWEGDVRRFAPTVLTLSVASSTGLYLLLFAVAPMVARALGSSDATTLLRVLGISVIVDGVACVPYGLLTRTFAQRRRMVIDLANFLATTALTVGLAIAGYGAMSFAWGSIAGNVVALGGCAIAAPGMLRPGWNREQARKLLSFGLPLAGASLLVLAMLNTDSIVVGATLGPFQLGLYQIAFNISSWPVRVISEAARRVSFAGFSRVADSPKALAASFGGGLSLLMGAAVPTCVLLAVLPKPLINFVYGGQWTDASGALRFLAVLGLLRIAYELAYDCLVAAGHRRSLISVQGIWLIALVPVLIFAARARGIAGVGFGHVLVAGPIVAPLFVWALARAGIPVGTVLRACARPFLGGCAMTVVCLAVLRLNLGETTGMFVASGLATAVYVPFVWPLIRLARGRSGKPAPDDEAPSPQEPTEQEGAHSTHGEPGARAAFPFDQDTLEIALPELRPISTPITTPEPSPELRRH